MLQNLEPRVYELKITFSDGLPWTLEKLCHDLSIRPEQSQPIGEDDWGLRDRLELWFLEVDENALVLHVQKKHSTSKKKYLEDLETFLCDMDALDYVANCEEINHQLCY